MRFRTQSHATVPKQLPPRVAPRVAVLPLGTRGDHQPFIPLAQALVAKGCTVEFWCLGDRQVEFVQAGRRPLEPTWEERTLAATIARTLVDWRCFRVLPEHVNPRHPCDVDPEPASPRLLLRSTLPPCPTW